MRQISPEELKEWIKEGRAFDLIDVREDWEHEAFHIGGALIPLGSVMATKGTISHQTPVVMYCEKGVRSVIAIQRLEALGFDNLYNLTGGMKAWRSCPDT